MFAMVGARSQDSRGPKRALVALARALKVDVDIEATNGTLGEQIAMTLDARWPVGAVSSTGQITLFGMNALLAASAERLTSTPRLTNEAPGSLLPGHEWRWFVAARSKIEAVNRISSLTDSGPEELGPGAKERKSVLSNLAARLFPDIDTDLSKVELGAALASRLGVPWTDACASTGYTITLDGLNVILAGAERHIGAQGFGLDYTATREANALIGAMATALPPSPWLGRDCIEEMRADEFPHWRQSEWPGFYLEFRALPALTAAYGLPEGADSRRRYGNTIFDYQWQRVWDLKAHTTHKVVDSEPAKRAPATAILNDADAIRACVERDGLGFLVVGGASHYEEDFDDWHRDFTRREASVEVRSNSGKSRRRKAAFAPTSIDAWWIPDTAALTAAIAQGVIRESEQGRQRPRAGETAGATRRPKFLLKTSATTNLQIARRLLTA